MRNASMTVLAASLALLASACSSSSRSTATTTTTVPTPTSSSTTSIAATSTTAAGPHSSGCLGPGDSERGNASPSAWIQMVSSTVGYAVIGHQIVGTVDGSHWSRLYVATEDLSYVDAVDASHVWALGRRSVFSTSDGGRQWRVSPPSQVPLTTVRFIDTKRGWAVSNSAVLQTTDGGRRWDAVPTPCPVDRVCFDDAQHGWLASRTSAYVTTDGGEHWSRRLDLGDPNFASATALDVQCTPTNAAWISFDSNNHAAGSDGYAAYRCPPNGACRVVVQNFLTDAPPDTSGPGSTPGPMSAIDEHTAAFVGFTGPVDNPTSVMVVSDDGRVRSPVYRVVDGPPMQATPQSVSFVSPDRGWLVDGVIAESHILATTDGGRTWTVQYRAAKS